MKKVRIETPEEVELGKDFIARVVEVSEPVVDKLPQAQGEREVFLPRNGKKCWLQNPETAAYYGGKNWIERIDRNMTLDELNEKYPTGETLNILGEPKRARDIYYPETEKPYPFKGLRALLTLGPKPTNKEMIENEFNALDPYSGTVEGWTGNFISIPKDRPGPVILRFTGDEPDCRGHDPEKTYGKYLTMKDETPDIPVGLNLCCSLGCGRKGTAGSVVEYKREWIEVANKVDYVTLNIYPYRKREGWEDSVAVMERFYNEWKNIITVPVIPVIQAHWITDGLTKPDPMEQVRFWFGKGLTGYIVYCWKDEHRGVCDMIGEWLKANLWAKKEVE